MNIVDKYASDLNGIFDNISKSYQDSLDEISTADRNLEDLYHEIEISKNKDMYQGYLMYMKIKEQRLIRRQAKEKAEMLKGMNNLVKGSQITNVRNTLSQLQNHAHNLEARQDKRVYAARERDDLTIEGVHNNTKTFEDMMTEFNKTKITMKGGKLRK